MNHRNRVTLALEHQEADRIPIDLGGTIISSIAKKAYVDLKQHLGMPLEEIKMLDYVQQLPYVDETLMQRFDIDFRMVQLPAATAPNLPIFEEGDYYAFIDRWGSKLHMPKDGGFYFDWVDYPIKTTSLEVLDGYAWPRPDPQELNRQLRDQAEHLYQHTDYAIVGSGVIGGGIFEQPARIMGMQRFLEALAAEPKFAERVMDKITEIYIESCDNYLEEVGEFIQVFTYWDDVCTQDGWMISPAMYRRMIKPRTRILVDAIKKKTKAKLFYHSCGASYDLIPDLIDLGFDILNPVQVSAKGMDTQRLKRDFGRDIVFWGGIDTQKVLPFGDEQAVKDEVKRRIDDLAPGGGFVLAAVHNIQALVPPRNIVTMFDTALEYGTYH